MTQWAFWLLAFGTVTSRLQQCIRGLTGHTATRTYNAGDVLAACLWFATVGIAVYQFLNR